MATDPDLSLAREHLVSAQEALLRLESRLPSGMAVAFTTSWPERLDDLLSEPRTVPYLVSALGVGYWKVMYWLRVCVTYGLYRPTGRGYYERVREPVPWAPSTPDAARKAVSRAAGMRALVHSRGSSWPLALRDDVLRKLSEVSSEL